jgi:riboflavin kinase/FMN adenylyltransferase
MEELYRISGTVQHGESRGKELGFPTANIRLYKKIPEGIYAGSVMINGKSYQAAVFVGSAKTFQKTDVHVECYIFDFDKSIYGKWITVKLYKKIRENQKFENADTLVEQMEKDIEEIKIFFTSSTIKN